MKGRIRKVNIPILNPQCYDGVYFFIAYSEVFESFYSATIKQTFCFVFNQVLKTAFEAQVSRYSRCNFIFE